MSLVFKTPKSTLNTTTGEGQNIGSGECPECPECPKVELSDVDVKYTENGEYTLTPEGDGFSSVGITVNIDTQAIEDAAYAEGEAAGIITGKAQGVAEQKAKLESATFVSNGTYTKEDGYNEVTVNVPSDVNNQTKNVTISSNGTEIITADSGYSGLGSVEVTVDVPEKQLTDTFETYTTNGEYTITPPTGYDGFSEVNVSVQIDEQAIYQDGFNSGLDAGIAEQKAKLTSTTISSNDTYSNEDGWNEVIVDIQPNLDVLEVTPSTQSQQFLPESGSDGFSQVDVDAVTSAIDSNITASNIKKDVTILGVTGSYDPQPNLETGTFTIDTIGTTTFTPDRVDGFDSVEITVDCPLGSYGCPFDSPARAVETDYETACYLASVQSGEINERTGYYDATGQGNILHIKPYQETFPEDFDLTDRLITVEYNKSDLSPIYDRETLVGVEINDCSLLSIDDNGNSETWQFGTLRVTENGSVDPTGYEEIVVEVEPTLQTKSVVPSDRQQVITPDRDYDGLSEVTVSGVTAAIDQNITASNIKDGVTILGVTGTYDPQPSLESKTASYTANGTYTITPSTGYDGMDEVEVTVNVSGGSGTQCPDWSSIGWDCNTVTASGLEADIAYTAQKKAEYEAGTINNFLKDTNLKFAPNIEIRDGTGLGAGYSTFANCSNLTYIPIIRFASGSTINCTNMFKSTHIINCIIENTAQPTSTSYMFEGCTKLESVGVIDATKVKEISGMFGNSSTYTGYLSSLGGFLNLGKAFLSTSYGANVHKLNLSGSRGLTKESIMNVINNLAAPDDTAVTDATLILYSTSYALLTEEDIAIATAKNWSVVSA